MEQVLEELLKAGGVVLTGVLVTLAVKLLQRFGIALDVERQQQLEDVTRKVVLKIEEVAAAQANAKVREWTGPEKLQNAVAEIVDKLPRVDREEAKAIVHAVLPTMGIGAAAGAVELGKALRTQ